MPDLKIHHSGELFVDAGDKTSFMNDAAAVVAHALDCSNYDGEGIGLLPEHIDVFLVPHRSDDVTIGAHLVVEIIGYDYPDRMHNIRERLTTIKQGIRDITGLGVSVSFIAIGEGCWV